MVTVRPSHERGRFDHGWLDTAHTFSFGRFHDPDHMGFRALRVINEDVVAPGRGFDTHPHRDMEIVTWVLDGALEHKDSAGNIGVIRPGEAQRMTAGRGIFHSEYNHSRTAPVHLLQIWIHPERNGLEPGHEQREFPVESRENTLRLIASPDGADGSLTIHQDARIYATVLRAGKSAGLDLAPGRAAWVQVAKGRVRVNGQALGAGDGASVEGEPALRIEADEDAEALVFDLA